MPTFYIKRENNDLIHYGVMGMRWGVRRYQNKDGTLTAKGKKRYGESAETRTRVQLSNRLIDSKDKEEALSVLREGDKNKNLKDLKGIRNEQLLTSYLQNFSNGLGLAANFMSGNLAVGILIGSLSKANTLRTAVSTAKINELIKTIEKEVKEEIKEES